MINPSWFNHKNTWEKMSQQYIFEQNVLLFKGIKVKKKTDKNIVGHHGVFCEVMFLHERL